MCVCYTVFGLQLAIDKHVTRKWLLRKCFWDIDIQYVQYGRLDKDLESTANFKGKLQRK